VQYWNRANFEGLSQLAEALREEPHLALLSNYCRFREQGLRREAFTELNVFLDATAAWPVSLARLTCQTILEIHARTPEAHQFLTQPLLSRFVYPVLEAWVAEDAHCQFAIRWLGLLRRDRHLLERALVLAPDDIPVRRTLVDWLLSEVEYSTHHLSESRFLGEIIASRCALAEARAAVQVAPDQKALTDLVAEIASYDTLIRDWETYSANPCGTFPEWCSARGRRYGWSAIVYYNK
jgi:hypothetical protein